MENTVRDKSSLGLAKKECKFCKCQNYTRQRCVNGESDSKLVREDTVVPRGGDKGISEKMKVQVGED